MSKHTPGPWRVDGTQTLYIEAVVRPGWLQEVAAVGPTEADSGYGEQQKANARLIASAPDLLDALKRIIDADDSKELTQHDIELGRAAIAKATGND
jgi:hypothetical protein